MRFIKTFAAVAVVSLAAIPADAADWPQWRGPNRNSVGEAISVSEETPLKEVWRAEVGTGFSSLVVSDGRLVTMGNRDDHDVVTCLDAESGRTLWEFRYECPLDPNLFEGGPTSTPTVDGSDVFTLSRRGDIHCLNVATGTIRWRANVAESLELNIPSWGFASSPLVHEGKVIVNVGSSGAALDRKTGEVLWNSDNSDEAGYASPTLFTANGRRLVLIMSGKYANAVDPQTGEVVWQHRWITRYGVNAADPYPLEGHVFLSSGYSKGSALLRLTGGVPEELWRSRELRNQLSPGLLVDGYVYAVDGDAGSDPELCCFSLSAQERTWSMGGLGLASLIRSGGLLIVLSEEGELLVAPVSAESFEPILRRKVIEGKCWTMPALANGKIYCRNANGTVVSLAIGR